MKQIFMVTYLCFLLVTNITAQDLSQKTLLFKIENSLLQNRLDSVPYFLSVLKKSPYQQLLSRLYENDNSSYKDYLEFITRISNHPKIKFEIVSEYINSNIQVSRPTTKINSDYVAIKWIQVSKLRDEVGIEEASQIQNKLEDYINDFNSKGSEVIKSKTLITTHQIVLFEIGNEVEKGKALCYKGIEVAENLKDNELKIIFLYHLTDFLKIDGKLDEYIKVSEECLQLENTLEEYSFYYNYTLQHLLDAYIYKRGYNDRVEELLNEMYENNNTRPLSYSLYSKYLSTINEDSLGFQSVLRKFGASSLIEFCNKTELLGKDVLNSNEYYSLLFENANALKNKGYHNDAFAYMHKCIILIRKIYSEDLSKTLASFEIKQAVKQKNIEIKAEKERSKLYVIISSLVLGLLMVSLFLIFRIRKQSQALKEKNLQINKTLKEKELLVKEVHHRVKNNFQIVASLLELQTKGIEDEKALALANEGKNRVKSMALIHQKLYQNEDGLIKFNEYIQLLVKEISSLYVFDKEVETTVQSEGMNFDVDTAIPLGLIINELITNSFKYAFNKDEKHSLFISIIKEKEDFKLIVLDSGSGLDHDFKIEKAKSLGLRLVSRLVRQLQGSIQLSNENGAKFVIVFKDFQTRKEID